MATKVKTTTTVTKTEITWACATCKAEWKTKWQADSCCQREEITWVCGECKNEWRTKSQAESCCGPTPSCARCGRDGHSTRECYAQTHEGGHRISSSADRGAG